MRWRAFAVFPILCAGMGCPETKPPSEELVLRDECDDRDGGVVCHDGVALSCKDGDIASRDDCAAHHLMCSGTRGCEACRPGYYECDGSTLLRCSDDGLAKVVEMECPAGTSCSANGCSDLCARAKEERSYIGCDYWAAFTLNSLLDPVFRPAIVVGNPQFVPAHVSVTKAGVVVAEADVAAGSASTLVIPQPEHEPLRAADRTLLARQAAYHVTASVPVIAHQFNPLLFEVDQECFDPHQDEPLDGRCNSFTNDASLLLPSHVLTREDGSGVSYLGVSRATFLASQGAQQAGYAGFLALMAVGDAPIHVQLRSSAYTQAGDEVAADGSLVAPSLADAGVLDAGAVLTPDAQVFEPGPSSDAGVEPAPAFAALAPGDLQELTLNPGDVFQLLSQIPSGDCPFETGMSERPGETVCDPGALYDLTGSHIEADGPLQLIGGHDCTYVPFNQIACDHLEETVFPLETWGQQVIVGGVGEEMKLEYRVRVLSGADGNLVSFDPPISPSVTLARGQWVELATSENVLVTGTQPLLVAQYLEGQGKVSLYGDPSLTLVPPVEQYRNHYNFLSPATYTSNYVTVIAPVGEDVMLDGDTVLGFEPLGQTGYAIATKKLEQAGAHELYTEGGAPVGIALYGFGAYTSYMLPGGLDLRLIADLF
ncbi:MAG: IgGFc-binding protein [Myxococcales bacterium]